MAKTKIKFKKIKYMYVGNQKLNSNFYYKYQQIKYAIFCPQIVFCFHIIVTINSHYFRT